VVAADRGYGEAGVDTAVHDLRVRTSPSPNLVRTRRLYRQLHQDQRPGLMTPAGPTIPHCPAKPADAVAEVLWPRTARGRLIETDPPHQLPANDVIVLEPYGSLLFAAAPVLEAQLPTPTSTSRNSVVILRLRGRQELDSTVMGVLRRYAAALKANGSRLIIVSASDRVQQQLRVTGVSAVLEPNSIYSGDERLGASLKRAYTDAAAWVEMSRREGGTDPQHTGEDMT
jgi:anti-anti-sigma factor